MINSIVKLLQNADPVNRELGFNIAMGQGVGFLNQCIAACGGYLNMSETGISELPEGFKLSGWLDLRGCTALLSLPENLTVGRWLDLRYCTALQSLPEGISVGSSLYLYGCTSLKISKIATIKGIAGRIFA